MSTPNPSELYHPLADRMRARRLEEVVVTACAALTDEEIASVKDAA